VNGEDTPGAHEIEEWAQTNNLFYSEGNSGEYPETPNNDHEAREQLRQEMSNKDIYADFNESAKETIEYVPELFDRVNKDFPNLRESFEAITYSDFLPDDKGALYKPGNSEISYNKHIFNSLENLKKYLNNPPGYFASSDPKSVIAHEFGHAIEKLIISLNNDNEAFVRNNIRQVLRDNGFTKWSHVENKISQYAGQKKSYTELIAELVSDYLSEKKPRNISISVYNKLMELYRGSL
jgi:hypothetical protein